MTQILVEKSLGSITSDLADLRTCSSSGQQFIEHWLDKLESKVQSLKEKLEKEAAGLVQARTKIEGEWKERSTQINGFKDQFGKVKNNTKLVL